MRDARTLLFAALVGCSKESPSPPAPSPSAASSERMVDGHCVVGFRCPGDRCLDLTERIASLRDSTGLRCKFEQHCPASAETGTCGPDRYTRFRDGSDEEITWFHADGKPFARREVSPFAIYCDKQSKEADYGAVPSCTPELTEDIVPGSPTPRYGRALPSKP